MFGFSLTSRNLDADSTASHKDTVHNMTVCHDGSERVRAAIRYLKYDLDRDECLVFFNQARRTPRHMAEFEDEHEHDFVLTYDSSTRHYTLSKE